MNRDDLAQQGRYSEALAALAGDMPWGATFIEIGRFLSSYITVDGGLYMYNPAYPNVILWINMSQELLNIIQEAIQCDLIVAHKASPMLYIVAGNVPRLPTARGFLKYKDPHWLPVAFYPKNKAKEE